MLDRISPRNVARRALIAAACLTLWACDSADDDLETIDAEADPEAEERDGEAAHERDADDAPELDAAVRDGSARDAGASDAGRDDRLQPFEVGRRWSYSRVALDGGGDAACMGSLESYITKQVMRDAAVGYEYKPTCLGDTGVDMFFSGDDIWAWVGSAPQPVHYAASPVEPGVMWDSGTTQLMWEAQDKVTVNAGTFDRCIRRTGASDKSGYIVLCRGVGLVLSESRSENVRMELVSKNF